MIISPQRTSPFNLPLVSGGGFVGLLDEYGGAAAAYSVRRLSSAYSGALMEVRRTVSAVTVTADVSFDSNNELSLDSEIIVTGGSSNATNLGEFVAAAGYSDPDSLGSGQNAFVRTWYDQSGNGNNAQQTTIINQPQIVSSGSVISENSKPSLLIDGNDFLSFSSILPITSFTVSKVDTVSTVNYILYGTGGYFVNGTNSSNLVGIYDGGASKTVFLGTITQKLYFWFYNGSNFEIAQDGGAVSNTSNSINISISSICRPSIFALNGKAQEIIIYEIDNSNNKNHIESNINSYYSIY